MHIGNSIWTELVVLTDFGIYTLYIYCIYIYYIYITLFVYNILISKMEKLLLYKNKINNSDQTNRPTEKRAKFIYV